MSNVQKHDKSQSCINWLPLCVRLTSLTMVNLSNSECVDMVMLYGVAHENATRNCGSNAFQIARFRVREHFQDYSTFKPQTHDRGRDRTERILQAEEQIL